MDGRSSLSPLQPAQPRKLPFGSTAPHTRPKRKHPAKPVLSPHSENIPPSLKRTPLDNYFSPPRKLIIPDEPDQSTLPATLQGNSLEVRCLCEEEEIPEKFVRLVEWCRLAGSGEVTEVEVLVELIGAKGDVRETIGRFNRN